MKGSSADSVEATDEDSMSESSNGSASDKPRSKKNASKKKAKKKGKVSNRSRTQKRKYARANNKSSNNKKRKSVARVDEDDEYNPSSQQLSFETALKDAEDDYDADDAGDEESMDGVAGQGQATTNSGGNPGAERPNMDIVGVETSEALVEQATLLCRQAIVQLIQNNGENAVGGAVSVADIPPTVGMAEAVWAEVVGTNTTETVITYNWIPVSSKQLTPTYVQKELAILGTTTATDAEIDDHIEKIISMKLAVVALTKSRIYQAVIAQAQAEGITYKNRTVTRFQDVGKWWASLTLEQASENAEKMFRIQQLPFENGGWSMNLSDEIMKVGKLVYHVQPNKAKNAKGCIQKIIRQIRINQTKILTWPSKKGSSHGHYITVKREKGDVTVGKDRRQPGEFKRWMFMKHNPTSKRINRGSGGVYIAIDQSRPHHIGAQVAAAVEAGRAGNPIMGDASVVAPRLRDAVDGVQDGGGVVSAAATALEEARKEMARMKAEMQELRSGNSSLQKELLDFHHRERQDGIRTLQNGGKGRKTSTNPKPVLVPKKKAGTGSGKGNGTAASAMKKPEKGDEQDTDLANAVSFDSNAATTVTEPEPEACDSSVGSSSSDGSNLSDQSELPVVWKIVKGDINKKDGICMITLIYKDEPKTPV